MTLSEGVLISNNAGTYNFKDSASGNIWMGFDISTGAARLYVPSPKTCRRVIIGPPYLGLGTVTRTRMLGSSPVFANNSGFYRDDSLPGERTWALQFRIGATGENPGEVTGATLGITEVPEPSRVALVAALGLAAFAVYRRWRTITSF